MTSLKSFGTFRSDWVTPERLLLLIPLVLGSGIAALMAIVLYLPLLYQVNRLGGLVQGLTDKVALLPVNRQRLGVQLQRFEQARSQEELLLNLVAGPGQLQTLQAELSQLARRSGVAITGFEPRSGEVTGGSMPVNGSATASSASASAGGAATASPGAPGRSGSPSRSARDPDPLLRAGLRKKSVLLTVKGPYPSLREFLVAVENLNVIAIATELKLNTGDAGSTAMPSQAPTSVPTTMTLVLSTYDRPGLDPATPTGVGSKPGVPTP
jgi:type IV pilus assembly protein PilO